MKLLTIELDTADLAGTRFFYSQKLDLPVVAESVNAFTVQIGWTQLTFRSVMQPPVPYHFAINVPVGMLEVCMHWFDLNYLDTQACGQTVAEFREWRARAAYFFDNNGNVLEFISRYDLPAADANMTVDDLFQGVSELGIGMPCVAQATRLLAERFGIVPFAKAKRTPEFAALGDDNGLLILAKLHRNWLFTDIPAGRNNYRVTFEWTAGGPVQTLVSDSQTWLSRVSGPACRCPLAT